MKRRLATSMSRRTSSYRSAGSGTCVASGAVMIETWLPGTAAAPARRRSDTGTAATSGVSGRSPRLSSHCRSAVAHSAITTSLTLPPSARRISLISSSGSSPHATERRRPIGRLNGVGGALTRGALGSSGRRRAPCIADDTSPTPGTDDSPGISSRYGAVRAAATADRTGCSAALSSPVPSIPAVPGARAGAVSSAGRSRGSGDRSSRAASVSAAITPSTAAWCTFT